MEIIIAGPKASGKTTYTEALRGYFAMRGIACFSYSLAEPIREMARAVQIIGRTYGIDEPADGRDDLLMQVIGDEWGNQKDPLIWVKAAHKRIDDVTKTWVEKGLHHLVVIERVCHPFQAEAFPNAMRVYVDAPLTVRRERRKGKSWNEDHLSEIALLPMVDSGQFDLVFDTSKMTPDEMVHATAELVRERMAMSLRRPT